jgi:DNA (cytosine-5)-methyltransferase 1
VIAQGGKFISASLTDKKTRQNENRAVVDLFCGAGGFSLGAHLAKFRTAAAVDIDQRLTSSYRENFPHSNLLHADIGQIGAVEILRSTKLKRGEIVGVIGGPPCQGFSLIGKRDGRDPRNRLVWHFVRIVRELQPRFFIMENVPGLLLGTAKKVLEDALSELNGFEVVGPIVMDAMTFGAATRRERVVIVGYNKAHVAALSVADIRGAKNDSKHTVRDAISDLPEPADCDWLPYRKKAHSELSSYARRARCAPASHLGSTESRERLARNEVSGIKHTVHTAEVVKRFGRVHPGATEPISRCPRLEWTEPAPTLRAGTGPDRGSYQSIRPIHPAADRVITVREAARLQGFPDWFQFDDTKWHSFRMIGNSVSPLMSEALLRLVSERLQP